MSATETDISKMKVRIKSFIYLVCVCIDDNKRLEHQSPFASRLYGIEFELPRTSLRFHFTRRTIGIKKSR